MTGALQPAAQRWDGSKWTAQVMPAPEEAVESHLVGVSCTAPVQCMAIGTFSSPESLPYAELWE